MTKLTQEQQFKLQQVESTMRIENMPLTEQARQNAIDLLTNKKTADQIAEELIRKYKR